MHIITIDGPAGAGKSTLAKKLADLLNFAFLDTGAMYRAAALLGIRKNVDWNSPVEFLKLVKECEISVQNGRTFLDGEDVSEQIRFENVTEKVRYASDNPEIRAVLVDLQRKSAYSHCGGVVTEGRDQGTVVFPDAKYKFFLTATPEERARRRTAEMLSRGEKADYEAVLRSINERDARDAARAVGPLAEPPDAVRINSDGKSIDDVLNELIGLCR